MSYLKRVQSSGISRRSFVKAGAAAAAALSVAGVAGCSSNTVEEADESQSSSQDLVSGEWKTAACWHNCGGRCLNKVLVQDGVVVRQKTDDTHEDSWEYQQQRACPRGRSQQQQVFSAERIKYPMKRKNWQPGGGDNSNGELRGIDEWEQISWDEALELVAEELNRIYDENGPRSVYLNSYASATEITGLLNLKGGYVQMQASGSYGTWKAGPLMLGTSYENSNPDFTLANDRFDLKNADTIVLYGCNPVWSSASLPNYNFMEAKKEGVNYVYVGPSYNVSAQLLDATWIRVRPGTDTAFLLAVAYVMITQDDPDSNPLIDWDFLDRCTVGFDADHMPDDAVEQENFQAYVLGEYDDIPKTPEWASEICGTPVEDIEWYANTIGCQNNVMLLHSYPAGRCYGAEDLPQLYMTVGAMGGHMGKSGNACAAAYQYEAANSGTRLVSWGSSYVMNLAAYVNGISDTFPGSKIAEAIVDGRYWPYGTLWKSGTMGIVPGEWVDVDIKAIVSQTGNFFQSRCNTNKMIEAYRKVDFVLNISYDFNPGAQYSDIILPACTVWETPWTLTAGSMLQTWINRETLILPQKICEPLYESKTDYEIVALLADAMGIDRSELFMNTPSQAMLDIIAGATVVDEDGVTPKTLVTITEDDLSYYNEIVGEATCETQEGVIGLRDFFEQGIYQVERYEGDNYGYIGYQEFREDPEANPRPSNSGKLEIYCQQKADSFNTVGFMDEEYKGYPTYHVPIDGYEASFSDWDSKTKGEYPYQMYTPHYLRRSHTTLDNLPWLREAFANPVFISASDAEEKGISTGDTVRIYNQYGQVLRRASVTEGIMPGCVALPHGPWPKIDPDTGIDYGGNENVLTGGVDNPQPQLEGFNTVLVNYELWDEELPLDQDAEACDTSVLG